MNCDSAADEEERSSPGNRHARQGLSEAVIAAHKRNRRAQAGLFLDVTVPVAALAAVQPEIGLTAESDTVKGESADDTAPMDNTEIDLTGDSGPQVGEDEGSDDAEDVILIGTSLATIHHSLFPFSLQSTQLTPCYVHWDACV